MEGKRGGGAFAPASTSSTRAGKTPESARGSDSDADMADDSLEGYRYKPDGLMKQSFSITTSNGQHLHLISYYSRSHSTAQPLNQPSNDPNLRHIRPQKGMYPESTVHEQQNVPVVTRGPIPGSQYAPPPHTMHGGGPPAYVRPGANHPLGYSSHSGYGWPPSPISTPPHGYPVTHYGGSSHRPPPGQSSAGASPLQYTQNLPPSSAPSTLTPTAYDRPPAALSENHLPPPLPPPLHSRSEPPNGPSSTYAPVLSPRIAHGALISTQQLEQGHHLTSHPLSKVDTRLSGNSTTTTIEAVRDVSRTPPGVMTGHDNVDVHPVRDPPSSSKKIPGIGTLVNGAPDLVDSKSDESGSQTGSHSPRESSKNGIPQDIPSDKLGFGEDVRALRVLDRAFSA
ncbi:MAG: hypothetical protein M1825_005410 [Sarcosagium campestre]|nr:MAG: hypothetical protein M1825_005410 [Sarcosagium campestre]